jgi:hypothetical protein
MEEASDLLGLYKVESRLDAALEQCTVLVQSAEHLSQALAELNSGALSRTLSRSSS